MGRAPALPEQLVEGAVASDPAEPLPSLGEGGEMEVGRFTRQVLAVGHTAHQGVESGATIARADRDGLPGMLAQRLQHLFTERHEVWNEGLRDAVVDTRPLSRLRAGKLRETEMWG